MLNPSTLDEALAQIRNRHQKNASVFDAYAADNLTSWVDDLSRLYPWWFLTDNPGTLLPPTFPISDLATVPMRAGGWAALGWLVVQPGVAAYDIWTVYNGSRYLTNPADSTQWYKPKLQEVRYVYEFSPRGYFQADMDIQDDVSAMTFLDLSKRGRPVQAMWRSLDDSAQLVFYPIPDKYYLYCVSFTQTGPPFYTTDGGLTFRNKWLDNCPEALVQFGLMEASQYFDEPAIRSQAEARLYGVPANIFVGRTRKTRMGILDVLLNDTKKKQSQYETEKLMWFNSKHDASGRGGVNRYESLSRREKWDSVLHRRRIY